MGRSLTAIAIALLIAVSPAFGATKVFKSTTSGSPTIKGIDTIAFGPDGALLIGDGKGAQVIAVDTKDTTAKAWKAKPIEKFDEKVADKLGTKPKNIEFVRLAVNGASGKAYLAVRKQDERKTVILTIDGDGKIGEFSLEKVDYVAVPLPKVEKAPIARITDLTWAGDRILAATMCDSGFDSKFYTIPAPLDASKVAASGFSTNTWHVAHNKWETRAPMSAIMPLELKGKKYIVGSFVCTPVVRYPLDGLKAGEKVKGQSVAELGNGNQPRSMFTYTKGGKSYVLVNAHRMPRFHQSAPVGPSRYWAARLDADLLTETEKIDKDALWRVKKGDKKNKPITDRIVMAAAYNGVAYLDRLNDKQALTIKDDKGSWTLAALELP